jgi:hypothetical protein
MTTEKEWLYELLSTMEPTDTPESRSSISSTPKLVPSPSPQKETGESTAARTKETDTQE